MEARWQVEVMIQRFICGTLPLTNAYRHLTQLSETHALAFTLDGKKVASGSFGGSIQSWDLRNKTETYIIQRTY